MEISDIIIKGKVIENMIFTVRNQQVIFDSHLAELYKVETKTINRAVKRNPDRFPDAFCFQMTPDDIENLASFQIAQSIDFLRYQTGTLKAGRGQHRKYLPYVFTEQGVAMLSSVLRSEVAVRVSIRIMNAFVKFRKLIHDNEDLFKRMDRLEVRQSETDIKIDKVFKALERRDELPEAGIFYDGQVYDAWIFISDLIRKAQNSIILIDNYLDDTVLRLFAKRNPGVLVKVYSKSIDVRMKAEVEKFNMQYPLLELRELKDVHDRFILIDITELYHIGASLKDLGKKWFAFSKMNAEAAGMLIKLGLLSY